MTDTAAEPQPQPLSEFLLNYPELDHAAGRELSELAEAVSAMDRKGSMALKFEISKLGRDKPRVVVKVGTEVKPPKSDPDAGFFFPSPKGLSKDDPQQVRVDWDTGELITPEAPKE